MKHYSILISLLLNFILCSGQTKTNKPILSPWDSLYSTHETVLKQYKAYIDSLKSKLDTLTTKDSTIISISSNNSTLLGRIIKHKRIVNYGNNKYKCIQDITEEFYNSKGLISYIRRYHKSCSDRSKSDNNSFKSGYFERFEYDQQNNLILRVFNHTTPMTIKETYTFRDGKWVTERKRINATDFWK